MYKTGLTTCGCNVFTIWHCSIIVKHHYPTAHNFLPNICNSCSTTRALLLTITPPSPPANALQPLFGSVYPMRIHYRPNATNRLAIDIRPSVCRKPVNATRKLVKLTLGNSLKAQEVRKTCSSSRRPFCNLGSPLGDSFVNSSKIIFRISIKKHIFRFVYL